MEHKTAMSNLDHLIDRCQQGELDAFAELFHQRKERVYRLALTILRSEQDAEDVTQDVFLRVFRQVGDFQGQSAFNTWLTAIVVNACRDKLRRQRLRQAIPLEWLRRKPAGDSSAEMAEEERERHSLWACVDQMETQYRLPVILFYYEGLSADEVAQVLKLPVKTVYSRLNTAREKLRRALHETGEQRLACAEKL